MQHVVQHVLTRLYACDCSKGLIKHYVHTIRHFILSEFVLNCNNVIMELGKDCEQVFVYPEFHTKRVCINEIPPHIESSYVYFMMVCGCLSLMPE